MMLLIWIRGILARRFLRVAGSMAGVALTVALVIMSTVKLSDC